ncbi:related to isocitrate/isopropylmalate dehydrogenase [Phialocephala subalpina]|uniref:Related to isocitrate/isopropylmalate dehydrogenase n=1 Tax=Phialocephala subalpina TaxID=576137 RepID=A0A1L7WUQ5_9HELO|nr:related to isocitrate/isopropylmalate dehydrogenase [Phialocephala subalpina]
MSSIPAQTNEASVIAPPKKYPVNSAMEVVQKVAKTLGTFTIEFDHIPWGTAYYKEHGRYVEENVLEVLSRYYVSLFGFVGAPDVLDHISLWGLLLSIGGPLQLYANVRPVRTFPGTRSRLRDAEEGNIDWLLVRENSEDLGIATEVAIFTYVGTERIMRFAFSAAQARPRKLLTVVTKSNSMRNGMVLRDEVALKVSKGFPDVKRDKMLVNAMTVRMVNNPKSLDTVVGTNLHLDIISDLAAALAGSLGVAPSSNLDLTRESPSLFELVHDSAFDIIGKGVSNPVATIVMEAVENVCSAEVLTKDLRGTAKAKDVTKAVCDELAELASRKK